MARTTDDMAGKTADMARGAMDQAAAAGRDASERMQAAGGAVAEQGSQLGLKMLDQAEANTREAFRAMRDAAQASDISEVMRIQSDYLREQGSRSMTQAREIGELIAGFGRNAIGQFSGRS